MKRGTEEFNQQLSLFEHFKKHPQMKPFVGKYWNTDKKLLIIGELSYLTDTNSPDFNDGIIDDWYALSNEEIVNKYELKNDDSFGLVSCTNIAELIDKTDYSSRKHSVYKSIDKAIRSTGFKPKGNVFCYVAYMNFFQRPAARRGNIAITKADAKAANETLKFVISAIQPDYLLFASSVAWKSYDKSIFNGERVGHSPHPLSQWWYMASKQYASHTGKACLGREVFADFISRHNIFQGKGK